MAKFFDFSHLRGDIFGGLTAGVVALPLALAFGEASGAGPIAGVYGAIIVGFFAALFGGTPSQISGPTGPMIVVFAGVFASLSGDVSLTHVSRQALCSAILNGSRKRLSHLVNSRDVKPSRETSYSLLLEQRTSSTPKSCLQSRLKLCMKR